MKKVTAIWVLIFLLIASLFIAHSSLVWAENCSTSCPDNNLDKCIAECQKLIDISVNATKPHEQTAQNLEKEIADLDANSKSLGILIAKKKIIIDADEQKFAARQKLLDSQLRDFYKKNWTTPLEYFLTTILSGDQVGNTLHALAYRQQLINQERTLITSLVLEISDLNGQKKKLEETQNWLATKQKDLETTLAPIRDLVNRAKSYQSQLSQTVGSLSARQQELLAEKTGNFSTSVGDVPDTQDPNSSIDGFRNNAPSGSFAGFSFGAPHRKGMSQYGAYGRAKSGQRAEDILRTYYGNDIEIKTDYDSSKQIGVAGYGRMSIDTYTRRIYEVPNSWGDNGGMEALKAQAVAARSYALAWTREGTGGNICTDENCQAYQNQDKGGNWNTAVDATKNWVIYKNGKILSTWYAATSGGFNYSYNALDYLKNNSVYNTPSIWDTKCGNQGCWTNDAYEKIANSPWFYKAWYKPRFSSASRPNAWLSKDEFADIANAALLYKKDKNNLSHLSQTDKSNSDTWSRDEVRNRLGGEAINDVSSVSINYSTGGYTSNININGIDFDGGDFRQIFNIRAPGEIWLASALYNIERK